MARHDEVTDLVWQALCKVNVPSVKEPPGLVRYDGKRPDGSTLISCLASKAMAWDVTVVNTLAEFTPRRPRRYSEACHGQEITMCTNLIQYIFLPLALETLVPVVLIQRYSLFNVVITRCCFTMVWPVTPRTDVPLLCLLLLNF